MAHPAANLVDRPTPDVGRPALLVPVGSVEQHGPHLPLDTDAVIAVAVSQALAERLADDGVDAVVAPPVAYGASGEHRDFAGTTSIGTQALTLLLVELGRSAAEWAGRVVFVNGHGGNVEALAAAASLLVGERRPVAWLPCVPGPEAFTGGAPVDAHAGRSETSIMLALAPTRVRQDRLEAGNTAPITELMADLRAQGVRAVAPNGVLGDPRTASASEGEALLAAIVEEAWRRLASNRVDERGCLVAGPVSTDPTTGSVS